MAGCLEVLTKRGVHDALYRTSAIGSYLLYCSAKKAWYSETKIRHWRSPCVPPDGDRMRDAISVSTPRAAVFLGKGLSGASWKLL